MARFGRSRKTNVRLARAIGVACVWLVTLVPTGVQAGGAAAPSPISSAAPGAGEVIDVPETSAESPGDNSNDTGFPDNNPAFAGPNNIAQIPQATPTASPAPSAWSGDPVVNYQRAQRGNPYAPGIGSAEDFLLEGNDNVSPLGLSLRPDRRRLDTGETASGLLVLTVTAGGPAEKAGVKPYRHAARSTLEAVSVAGAFFFPPAMLLLPVLESTQLGDGYDLIIGVDGFRVTSALDFEDYLRDLQPGEIVYLSILRNGRRLQIPVAVPNLVQ